MIRATVGTCALLALGACNISQPDSTRIDVTENNALGVVTIETTRFEEPGANVFELRGLDANDHEVALVRQRIGTIDDLDRYLPGADLLGSEHTFSGSQDLRMVSREMDLFQFPAIENDPALQGLLELRPVAAALSTANIRVHLGSASQAGQRQGERSFDAGLVYNSLGSCPEDLLNTTPVANQCCYGEFAYYDQFDAYYEARYENFKAASGVNAGLAINKSMYPTSFSDGTCVSSTGGSCSGSGCYYGPNGFARPQVITNSTSYNVRVVTQYAYPDIQYSACEFTLAAGSGFATVTGTFPTSQGCPGGASGAGAWDY